MPAGRVAPARRERPGRGVARRGPGALTGGRAEEAALGPAGRGVSVSPSQPQSSEAAPPGRKRSLDFLRRGRQA